MKVVIESRGSHSSYHTNLRPPGLAPRLTWDIWKRDFQTSGAAYYADPDLNPRPLLDLCAQLLEVEGVNRLQIDGLSHGLRFSVEWANAQIIDHPVVLASLQQFARARHRTVRHASHFTRGSFRAHPLARTWAAYLRFWLGKQNRG